MGEDLPPISKGKVWGGNPAERTRRRWFLGRKHSTVLALSRTLCAGFAGAAAVRTASLTAAARGALPEGRLGQRDGRLRSNKGMGREGSRGDGLPSLMGGIIQGVLLQQGAGDGEQAVGDGAQGAAVAVPATTQCGVAAATGLVMLEGDARPMIERVLQPLVTGIAADDEAGLAAAPGYWCHTGQAAQGVIVSAPQRLPGLGEQHGEDDPSEPGHGSQDRHVVLLAVLPR